MKERRTSFGSRIVSMVLVLCMILGMVPAGAVDLRVFAADSTTETNVGRIRAYAEYLLSSNFSKAASATQTVTDTDKSQAFGWDTEGKSEDWRYFNGVMLDALLMLGVDSDHNSNVSTNSALEFAKDFLDANTQDAVKAVTHYALNEVDSVPPALVLFDLLDTAEVTAEDRAIYVNAINYVYEQLENQHGYTSCGGNYLHKQTSSGDNPTDAWKTYEIGLDGIYMAQPFLMEYANALAQGKITNTVNEDTAATIYGEVYTRLMWIANTMYDEESKLYNHGWNVDAYEGNGHFWGRGIGWYAAGLVMCIDLMPEGTYKTDLIAAAVKLFDGMLQYQDVNDRFEDVAQANNKPYNTGMWYNVVNRDCSLTDNKGNRLETSVSALMAYAMMKAYNEGWVKDSKYATAAVNAFNGIVAQKLSSDNQTITDTYQKSGVGETDKYYCTENYTDNEAKGVGGVIMAAAEIDKYLGNAEAFRAGVVVAPEIVAGTGSTPDFSGVKATVVGTQGTIKNLKHTDMTFSNADNYSKAGTATVTAAYNGVQLGTFEITLVDTALATSDARTLIVDNGGGGTSYAASNSLSNSWQISKNAVAAVGATTYSDYIDAEKDSTDSFFTYGGDYKEKEHPVTYNGTTANKPLKFDSKGSASFDSSKIGPGTLTMVFCSCNVGKTIKLDGQSHTIVSGTDNNGNAVGIVTITNVTAGSHTISKGNDETHMGYVSYASSGMPAKDAEYAKLIGEGTFSYEVSEKTAEEVLAEIQAAYDVYMGNASDGSDAEAQADAEAKWEWLDTYNAAVAGTYRVKVTYGDNNVELGTITVAVNAVSGTAYSVELVVSKGNLVLTEGCGAGQNDAWPVVKDANGNTVELNGHSLTTTSSNSAVFTNFSSNYFWWENASVGETTVTIRLNSVTFKADGKTHTIDDVSLQVPVVVNAKVTEDTTHVHSYTVKETTVPTCIAAGVFTFTCSCGTNTQPAAALGHNYVNGVCSRCGNVGEITYTIRGADGNALQGQSITLTKGQTYTPSFNVKQGTSNMTGSYQLTLSSSSTAITISGDGTTITAGEVEEDTVAEVTATVTATKSRAVSNSATFTVTVAAADDATTTGNVYERVTTVDTTKPYVIAEGTNTIPYELDSDDKMKPIVVTWTIDGTKYTDTNNVAKQWYFESTGDNDNSYYIYYLNGATKNYLICTDGRAYTSTSANATTKWLVSSSEGQDYVSLKVTEGVKIEGNTRVDLGVSSDGAKLETGTQKIYLYQLVSSEPEVEESTYTASVENKTIDEGSTIDLSSLVTVLRNGSEVHSGYTLVLKLDGNIVDASYTAGEVDANTTHTLEVSVLVDGVEKATASGTLTVENKTWDETTLWNTKETNKVTVAAGEAIVFTLNTVNSDGNYGFLDNLKLFKADGTEIPLPNGDFENGATIGGNWAISNYPASAEQNLHAVSNKTWRLNLWISGSGEGSAVYTMTGLEAGEYYFQYDIIAEAMEATATASVIASKPYYLDTDGVNMGERYVILAVCNGKYYALTHNGSSYVAVEVTVADGIVQIPAGSSGTYEWLISEKSDDTVTEAGIVHQAVTISNDGEYVNSGGSSPSSSAKTVYIGAINASAGKYHVYLADSDSKFRSLSLSEGNWVRGTNEDGTIGSTSELYLFREERTLAVDRVELEVNTIRVMIGDVASDGVTLNRGTVDKAIAAAKGETSEGDQSNPCKLTATFYYEDGSSRTTEVDAWAGIHNVMHNGMLAVLATDPVSGEGHNLVLNVIVQYGAPNTAEIILPESLTMTEGQPHVQLTPTVIYYDSNGQPVAPDSYTIAWSLKNVKNYTDGGPDTDYPHFDFITITDTGIVSAVKAGDTVLTGTLTSVTIGSITETMNVSDTTNVSVDEYPDSVTGAGWMTDFSDAQRIETTEQSWIFNARSYATADKNWFTPMLVIYEGEIGENSYKEWAVIRSDNWQWTSNNAKIETQHGNTDWGTWLNGNIAGIVAKVTASKNNKTVTVTFENNGLVSKYTITLPNGASEQVFFSVFTQEGTVTDLEKVTPGVTATAPGNMLVLDGESMTLPLPTVKYNNSDATVTGVTYVVKNGSEYVTVNGNTVTGIAPGVATITAKVTEINGNTPVSGIWTDFQVGVHEGWQELSTNTVDALAGDKVYFLITGQLTDFGGDTPEIRAVLNNLEKLHLDYLHLMKEGSSTAVNSVDFTEGFGAENWRINSKTNFKGYTSGAYIRVDDIAVWYGIGTYLAIMRNEGGNLNVAYPVIVTENGTYSYDYRLLIPDAASVTDLSITAIVVHPVADQIGSMQTNYITVPAGTTTVGEEALNTLLEGNGMTIVYEDGTTGTVTTNLSSDGKIRNVDGEDVIYVTWNNGNYSIQAPVYVQYSVASEYVHEVDVYGNESNFFDINASASGSYDHDYKYVDHNDMTLTLEDALKMGKNGTIKFTTLNSGKLYIVAGKNESNSNFGMINGSGEVQTPSAFQTLDSEGIGTDADYSEGITESETAYLLVYDVKANTDYTIARSVAKEALIYYVAYVPDVDSSITVETPDTLHADGDHNTVTLKPTVVYNNVQLAGVNYTVEWSSADTSIATVDANGVVSAVAKGETTVTATLVAVNGQTLEEKDRLTTTVPIEVEAQIIGEAYLNSYDYIVEVGDSQTDIHQELLHMVLTLDYNYGTDHNIQYDYTADSSGNVTASVYNQNGLVGTLKVDTSKVDTSKAGLQTALVTFVTDAGVEIFRDTVWIHVESYDYHDYDGSVTIEEGVTYELFTGDKILPNEEYIIVGAYEDVAVKNPDTTGTTTVAPQAQTVKINGTTLTVNYSMAPMVEWLIDTEVSYANGLYQYNVSNFLRYMGGNYTNELLHGGVTHVYIRTCDASQGLYYLILTSGYRTYYLEYVGGQWVANTSATPVRLFMKKVDKIYDVPVDFEITDPKNGKTEDNRFQIPVGYEKTIELMVKQNDVLMDNEDCTFSWEILEGEEYVSLDQNGNLVAKAEGQAKIRVWLTHINDSEVFCNVHDLPHIERDLFIDVVEEEDLIGHLEPDTLKIGVGSMPNLTKVRLHMLSGETPLFTVGYENLEFMIAESDLDINTVGEYIVDVKYQGETYELTIKVVPDPYEGLETADSIPSFPDAGAVRIDKKAQGVIDFNATGVAEVELTVAGVSTKSSVDVLLIVDVSNSMGWTDNWFNYDSYGTGEGKTAFPAKFEAYWTAYKVKNGIDAENDADRRAAWADFVLGKSVKYNDGEKDVSVRGAKDSEKIDATLTDGYFKATKLYSAMESAKSFADILLNVEGGDNTLSFVTFAGHDDQKSTGENMDSVRTPFVSVENYADAAAVFNATKFTSFSINADNGSAQYYLDIGGHESGDPAVYSNNSILNRGNTNYDFAFGEAIDAVEQIKYNYEENNPGKSYDDSGRQLVVVFMTDGAPSHYNDVKANGSADQLWYNSDATYSADDPGQSGEQNFTTASWITFIDAYNKYATLLYNEVSSIYTVGFDLDHGGFGDYAFEASALKPILEGMVKNKTLETTLASDKTALKEYYESLATSLAYAGTKAQVTDQIGTNFTLYTGIQHDTSLNASEIVINEATVNQVNSTNAITVKTYRLVTMSDIGSTMDIIGVDGVPVTGVELTEEHLGLRITNDGDSSTAEEQIIEKITFSVDGEIVTAHSNLIGEGVNIMSIDQGDVTITAKTFTYTKDVGAVRRDENGAPVLDKDGNEIVEAVEQFVWNLGTIDSETDKPTGIITDWEVAISYYAYLEGSFNNPQKTEAAVFDTNDYAYLEYVDSQGKYAKQTYEIPTVTWRDAVVTVKFFLVNEKGEYVNLANVPFNNPANRYTIPGKTAQYTCELNGDALDVKAFQALVDAGLYDEYSLYDTEAWAKITNNVNASIADEDFGGSVTGIAGRKDIEDLIIFTENSGNGTNVNVTIEFPVLIDASDLGESTQPMSEINVVMDYGKEFPVDVFSAAEGAYRVYVEPVTNIKYVMSVKGFAPYDPNHDLRDYVSGFSYSSTLVTKNGSYRVGDEDTILFTPSRFLEEVEKVFAAIRFEIYEPTGAENGEYTYNETTSNYYYMYKPVSIIPATVMYYEVENNLSGEFTYTGTHVKDEQEVSDWKTISNSIGRQDPHVVGEIYGQDNSYDDDTGFSNGGYVLANGQGVNDTQVKFTFTGTGFDIISKTDKDQTMIRVWVYSGTEATGTATRTVSVMNKGENNLYQLPVVSVDDLPFGTYTVVIGVFPGYDPDQYPIPDSLKETLRRGDQFYFDALRIYNPISADATVTPEGTRYNLDGTAAQEPKPEVKVKDLYKADGEYKPTISEVGQILIDAKAEEALVNGVIFLDDADRILEELENGKLEGDGDDSTGDISQGGIYDTYGANNEVYLAAGQGIAFILESNGAIPASVDIGAKSITGASVTLTAWIYASPESNSTTYSMVQKTIESNTQQYFSLMENPVGGATLTSLFANDKKAYVVIQNTGENEGWLSITDIKVAYNDDPEAAVTFLADRSVMLFAARRMTTPAVIPEPLNGMQKDENGRWYYYVDGVVDTSYTGLVDNHVGTWYVQNGEIILNYDGAVEVDGEIYYIKAGMVSEATTGVFKYSGEWLYYAEGKVDRSFTGVCGNFCGLWYVENGAINFNKSGLVEYEGNLLYFRYGQHYLNFEGLVKADNGDWLYVNNGYVDYEFVGLAKNHVGWWYVKNGTIDYTYNGTATNFAGTFNVVNGQVDASKTVE